MGVDVGVCVFVRVGVRSVHITRRAFYTMYNVQRTMYSVHYTVHIVHRVMYTVQCRVVVQSEYIEIHTDVYTVYSADLAIYSDMV